jgi:tetratricopeptide (TPR) repeat protein
MNKGVVLEVSEYNGSDGWLWRLKDGEGNFLARHQVDLKEDGTEECGYRGYHDLPAYLDDLSIMEGQSEKALLARVGRWMGDHILGALRPRLQQLLEDSGEMLTLRVVVPPEAQDLIFHPLELAWICEGKTLAEGGARLVWHRCDCPDGSGAKESEGALRILGVFSMPTDESPLNMRKERVAFKKLLHVIAETRGLEVEMRTLQYGTTRKALREVLRESPGWDVIHFSCHGTQGALLLEDGKGESDPIPAKELNDLLKPSRPRLKLLILSSCWSGAGLTHDQARDLLGLPPLSKTEARPKERKAGGPEKERLVLPSLAQDLARELDCAVLAMRYPVGDEFAIELASGLFEKLLAYRQPLAPALHMALKDVLEGGRSETAPALSPITPVLVGARSAALRLAPPKASRAIELEAAGLQRFPRAPMHFVGRVGPMLRASRALAPESSTAVVIFHGMAGGGKTACAVELSHLHEHGRFTRFVWFRCPDEGEDIQNAMMNCLEATADQLGMGSGSLISEVADPRGFRRRTVPLLRCLFEERAVLVVIDNMESLLTKEGNWLDEKWGDLIGALRDHGGLSRAVLTSRRMPADLAKDDGVLKENVTALSFRESVLLAKELQNLGALLKDRKEGAPLLLDALKVVQGHPKLIELSNILAADRARFEAIVKKAQEAAERDGAPLQEFLRGGESVQDVSDFTKALNQWVSALAGALSPGGRLMFQLLCRMENEDRRKDFIEANWTDFLSHLSDGHPEAKEVAAQHNGGLERAIDAVVGCGLAGRSVQNIPIPGGDWSLEIYEIHPGVAEAGREGTPKAVLDAVDLELGRFHIAGFQQGLETEAQGGGGIVTLAARRAVPYLMRTGLWIEAASVLEHLVKRDASPSSLLWALPFMRRIAERTGDTLEGAGTTGILAEVLLALGRYEEAERLLNDLISSCEARGEWRLASVAANDIVTLFRTRSRLNEALAWAEKKAEFSGKAGLGPWTRLADEGRRLQVLNEMGRWAEVLETVEVKRIEMESLPEKSDADEAVDTWNVREALLDTGHSAALRLKKWDVALLLNAQIIKWTIERGACAHEIARRRFNDYGPLIGIKRFDECRALLRYCRDVFQEETDYVGLGTAFSALADLEDKEGRPSHAAAFEKASLRYRYLCGIPGDCTASHNNLASYLERTGEPAETWLPHIIAAGLICIQSGAHLSTIVHSLAISGLPDSPPSFESVASTVESVQGVRFRLLFDQLPRTYPSGDAALAALWEEVRGAQAVFASLPPPLRAAFESRDIVAFNDAMSLLPEEEMAEILSRLQEAGIIQGPPDPDGMARELAPLLAGIAAVALGKEDGDARLEIDEALARLEEQGWHLREAVHRIWSGERDPDSLTDDLDAQDTAIIHGILEMIEGE